MAEWSPISSVKLLPGVRFDYARDARQATIAPRLSARWTAGETTLKGGVGVYHQPPQAYESVAPFGTPGIRSARALHYGAGVERTFGRVELSIDAFYKHMDDLAVQGAAATRTQSGVAYTNDGEGRVYGTELLLRYKADDRFFGWIAYTLSKSERREGAGAWHDFQYDQTHILTALGSYQLGRGWEVGGRFRYVTGSPYTPNVGGVADFDAGAYAPIPGAPFSARSSAFHSLDLRVEKTWSVGRGKVAAYADVQNVYNRRNPEGATYNFNYTRSQSIVGLPILPIIGVRGEL
jgi:outer membrane cobalamin receptor